MTDRPVGAASRVSIVVRINGGPDDEITDHVLTSMSIAPGTGHDDYLHIIAGMLRGCAGGLNGRLSAGDGAQRG